MKTGTFHTAESKNKIGAAQKGKTLSAEHRQLLRDTRMGENNPHFKPLSQEAKDILLSMPDFLEALTTTLSGRLRRKHKINAGPLAISLFQQESKN